MRKDKTVKTVLCLASMTLFLSIPTSIARAETAEQGVAGIAATLDNYFSSVQSNKETAGKELTNILNVSTGPTIGFSKADNYVNIRSKPSTDSEVMGKLYRGSAAKIVETLSGDWAKIESGDVKGYIAMNFLATGKNSEPFIEQYATKYATVINTETLRVREKQSVDSKTLTLIPLGETYVVLKEYDKWAEVLLGVDEDNGREFTGFVSKDYVKINIEYKYAISIEEENRRIREEQEAIRAEAERQERLRAEAAAKKAEEERRKAEEARKAAEARNNSQSNNANSNSGSSNSSTGSTGSTSGSSGSSSSSSPKQSEIVTYALKFVGNRYVWGGTSLTAGADCSGFVQSIYKGFGYSLPRVSRDQANAGRKVSVGERQPGDLIFYTNSRGTINHVAIYIGNDKIVHAANSRQGIITSKYNYRSVYTVRRILN